MNWQIHYTFYGFYLKNYWVESVFSRWKKNLPLKIIMTVIGKIVFYKQIETFIFSLNLNPPEVESSSV